MQTPDHARRQALTTQSNDPLARLARLRQLLLDWFRDHGRDYPWRRTTNPYHILVAELMLQRTTVGQVTRVYEDFICHYPTPQAAAAASDSEMASILRPLGLGRRAAMLRQALIVVSTQYYGLTPVNLADLMRLPGVGPYTARAVTCFSRGQDEALVDVNTARVLGRVLGLVSANTSFYRDVRFQRSMDCLVPSGHAREFNLALIDLAASVCKKTSPACQACPLAEVCDYAMRSAL